MKREMSVDRVESFRLDAETHERCLEAANEMGVRCSTLFRIIVRAWLRGDGGNASG